MSKSSITHWARLGEHFLKWILSVSTKKLGMVLISCVVSVAAIGTVVVLTAEALAGQVTTLVVEIEAHGG